MRKVLLFAMLLLPQLLVAQEIYGTYLKDGKQWVYKHHVTESECTNPDHDVFALGNWEEKELYLQSYFTVMGDTVRGKYTYKKLYYTDSYRDTTYLIATIGERRGLYYIYNEGGGSHVSYNFDLEVGDKNTPYSNQFSGNPDNPLLYVKSKDTIQVGDRYFERLSFSYKDNGSQFYPADPDYIMDVWIRGIGNRNEGVYGPFYNATGTGYRYSNGHWLIERRQFLACYDDGECIFRNTDFNANPVTGIVSQKRYRSSETATYDLSGRRVANSSEFQGSSFRLPKGVYIQSGKKVVVK